MNEDLPVRKRPTARVIVLDPADRILMFHANLGHSLEPDRLPAATGFWAVPGGGIEAGETPEAAARRELAEETGIRAVGPLPLVATRLGTFVWKGARIHMHEHFFFHRTEATELDTSGWQDGDRRWIRDMGWWTLAALAATRDIVRPPGLAGLAQRLSRGELPATPLALAER